MELTSMLDLYREAGKRLHLIGDTRHGVVAGLDLEGRLYTVYEGMVLNRVNPAAITDYSCLDTYHNPGGDGLWPAPEGTSLGYSYASGGWRVPAGIRQARFQVVDQGPYHATIQSEVDLINSQGLGLPLLFERNITLQPQSDGLTVTVEESVRYLGAKTLDRSDCLLAPWSLCQFTCGPGCEVVFPGEPDDVWELYDSPNPDSRYWKDGLCHTITDGSRRYQIGIGAQVPWIEYRDPARQLRVIRQAEAPAADLEYIDIRDAAPDTAPHSRGVRYSVYSDPAGFMEIEAAGGFPAVLTPGRKLSQNISTRYILG